MSFGIAAAMGLTGVGAAMMTGAVYGGLTTVGSNLIRGKDAFDNIGQGLLLGGAGAGIASGLGSAMGGKTIAELSGPAAQAELAAAGQAAGDAGLKASGDALAAANANTAANTAVNDALVAQTTANPAADLAADPYGQLKSGDQYRDFLNKATYRPPDFAANSYSPQGIAYQQSQGALPADIAQQAGENAANSSKFPGYSQATKDLMKPATLMKNPADYMVQNPSKVAGVVTGLVGLLKQPDPAAPAKPPGGDRYDYAYQPAKYGPDGRVVSPASYGTPTVTHYANGGSIPGFAEGVYIPQSKRIRTDIYGSNAGPIGESGRQMYKNTDKYAGLKAQLDKMSPTMLSKLSQSGTDSIVQAAATTELYDRANTANSSYMDQPTMQAAQGGIMRFGIGGSATATATAGGPPPSSAGEHHWYDFLKGGMSGDINSGGPSGLEQLLSQNPEMVTKLRGPDNYSYNPANQTYSGQGAGAVSSAPAQYSFDPTGQSYTPKMAAGGVASLPNEYAAGGKLLQGPGDGMSDSIPAVIKGAKPQRAALAQGEFVIPADVVSHLGNGSTDAGAKRLYAMMDKIRHARTGTKKQGKQINPANFMPA